MSNTPQNVYLQAITGNALVPVVSPSAGETYTNLWMVIHNTHTAPITITIFHNNGSDLEIVKKTIQSGKQEIFHELSGVKVNSDQLLKVQSSSGSGVYNVDLSANIVLDN